MNEGDPVPDRAAHRSALPPEIRRQLEEVGNLAPNAVSEPLPVERRVYVITRAAQIDPLEVAGLVAFGLLAGFALARYLAAREG